MDNFNFQINDENKIYNPITTNWIKDTKSNRKSIIRQVETKAEKDRVKKLRFNHSIIIYTLDGNKYNYNCSIGNEIWEFNCCISLNDFLRKQRNDNKDMSYKYFLKGEEDRVRDLKNDSTKNDIILYALPYVRDFPQFAYTGTFTHKSGIYYIDSRTPSFIRIRHKYGETWGEYRRMRIWENLEQEEYIDHQGTIIYPEELQRYNPDNKWYLN